MGAKGRQNWTEIAQLGGPGSLPATSQSLAPLNSSSMGWLSIKWKEDHKMVVFLSHSVPCVFMGYSSILLWSRIAHLEQLCLTYHTFGSHYGVVLECENWILFGRNSIR